tara:strand:+ start:112 stop:294 length:183 start_codon:yes stop_codon:yes gene_type:complete
MKRKDHPTYKEKIESMRGENDWKGRFPLPSIGTSQWVEEDWVNYINLVGSWTLTKEKKDE